jgi:hypothetical protein
VFPDVLRATGRIALWDDFYTSFLSILWLTWHLLSQNSPQFLPMRHAGNTIRYSQISSLCLLGIGIVEYLFGLTMFDRPGELEVCQIA